MSQIIIRTIAHDLRPKASQPKVSCSFTYWIAYETRKPNRLLTRTGKNPLNYDENKPNMTAQAELVHIVIARVISLVILIPWAPALGHFETNTNETNELFVDEPGLWTIDILLFPTLLPVQTARQGNQAKQAHTFKIVPTPMVIAMRGTFSSPKKSAQQGSSSDICSQQIQITLPVYLPQQMCACNSAGKQCRYVHISFNTTANFYVLVRTVSVVATVNMYMCMYCTVNVVQHIVLLEQHGLQYMYC